jgi:RNA polymerase sigma factor (sigma-70 family)
LVIPPDDDLQARLLAGEVEAVDRVSRWISHVLTTPRFWRLRQEWRDLHQETMTSLIKSLRGESFDASRDFRAYVQGIARHVVSQRYRKMRAESGCLQENHEPVDPADPERQVTRHQLIRRVLEMASEDCREVIVDFFLNQSSYEEIAEEQGVPVGTVKSRLFRCLESAYRTVSGHRSARPHLVKKE